MILFLFSFEICRAQQWFPLEGGLSGSNSQTDKVAAMCTDSVNHILYVGGKFLRANDSINVYSIAKWNGINWEQLISHGDTIIAPGDTGLIQYATSTTSLVIHNSNLYSTVENGNFHSIIEINLNSFVRRGIGYLNGTVNQLYVYEDTLYACGAFTIVNNTYGGTNYPISGIAKWDGTQWLEVGGGISVGGFSEVNALCVHHNKLYAAGIFENAGGTYCKNIACWNDTSWNAVGNGIGFAGDFGVILMALESYHGKLYAGGFFDFTATGFAHCMAVWNDTTWASAGINPGGVYTLKTLDDKLYMGAPNGGRYASVFNDTIWTMIPNGPTYNVFCFEKLDSNIYSGGNFNIVNDSTPCGLIARYHPTLIQDTTAIVEVKQNGSTINIYPNPATNEIKITNLSPTENQISIFNLIGQQVKSIRVSHAQTTTIPVSDLPAGIYVVTIFDGEKIVCKKLVKE